MPSTPSQLQGRCMNSSTRMTAKVKAGKVLAFFQNEVNCMTAECQNRGSDRVGKYKNGCMFEIKVEDFDFLML